MAKQRSLGGWGGGAGGLRAGAGARETVEALEGLSWAAWWVEGVPACLEARERAYRLCRREGDAAGGGCWRSGSQTITWCFGASARSNGWFQRAARILEGIELCPEHGWLDALLGYMAMVEGDQP